MITRRSNIIASGPQLATPVCLTQPGKPSIQLTRCDTLDHIHHLRWRITGWTTNKQMHMVRLRCQGFDFPVVCRTNLADQSLQSLGHIADKHPAMVSRNPNKVVCQPIDSVDPNFII
jgi:hypothetical protein